MYCSIKELISRERERERGGEGGQWAYSRASISRVDMVTACYVLSSPTSFAKTSGTKTRERFSSRSRVLG